MWLSSLTRFVPTTASVVVSALMLMLGKLLWQGYNKHGGTMSNSICIGAKICTAEMLLAQ